MFGRNASSSIRLASDCLRYCLSVLVVRNDYLSNSFLWCPLHGRRILTDAAVPSDLPRNPPLFIGHPADAISAVAFHAGNLGILLLEPRRPFARCSCSGARRDLSHPTMFLIPMLHTF